MRRVLICLLLLSCGRPLSEGEAAFATNFHGAETAAATRLHDGLWAPGPRDIPNRPRTTCQGRIWPPNDGPTMRVATLATVLFTDVYIRDSIYLDDLLPDLPDSLYLPDAMLLGHELVHVWQWQNRETTGYHPILALLEHAGQADPYLIDPETTADFESFGYEQQGAIMEEYICCRALAPNSGRTSRLHAMLGEHFDLPDLSRPLAAEIRLPYPELNTAGICDP